MRYDIITRYSCLNLNEFFKTVSFLKYGCLVSSFPIYFPNFYFTKDHKDLFALDEGPNLHEPIFIHTVSSKYVVPINKTDIEFEKHITLEQVVILN